MDLYKIAFSCLKGINIRLAKELLSRCGSEETFFTSTEQQLSAINSCRNSLFSQAYRDSVLQIALQEKEFVDNHHVNTLYFTDDNYPQRLLECDDAPIMLYGLGNYNLNARHAISIVGTRHATPYGNNFVKKLIKNLSERLDDFIIISGLAYGIDVAAHRAALDCGVPTVGVLAHGLNTIYPAQHRNIATEMIKTNGGLLSDYRSQDALHKGNFVARNRIVAGLCDCTIVVESAEKGGALITAGIAQAYHRDVFALPGRTSDQYSTGCNKLIKDNVAGLISCADDLVEAMQWHLKPVEGVQNTLAVELSPAEENMLCYLREKGEGSINTMCVDLNIPINKIMTLLVELEFKNMILPYPGGKYRPA